MTATAAPHPNLTDHDTTKIHHPVTDKNSIFWATDIWNLSLKTLKEDETLSNRIVRNTKLGRKVRVRCFTGKEMIDKLIEIFKSEDSGLEREKAILMGAKMVFLRNIVWLKQSNGDKKEEKIDEDADVFFDDDRHFYTFKEHLEYCVDEDLLKATLSTGRKLKLRGSIRGNLRTDIEPDKNDDTLLLDVVKARTTKTRSNSTATAEKVHLDAVTGKNKTLRKEVTEDGAASIHNDEDSNNNASNSSLLSLKSLRPRSSSVSSTSSVSPDVKLSGRTRTESTSSSKSIKLKISGVEITHETKTNESIDNNSSNGSSNNNDSNHSNNFEKNESEVCTIFDSGINFEEGTSEISLSISQSNQSRRTSVGSNDKEKREQEKSFQKDLLRESKNFEREKKKTIRKATKEAQKTFRRSSVASKSSETDGGPGEKSNRSATTIVFDESVQVEEYRVVPSVSAMDLRNDEQPRSPDSSSTNTTGSNTLSPSAIDQIKMEKKKKFGSLRLSGKRSTCPTFTTDDNGSIKSGRSESNLPSVLNEKRFSARTLSRSLRRKSSVNLTGIIINQEPAAPASPFQPSDRKFDRPDSRSFKRHSVKNRQTVRKQSAMFISGTTSEPSERGQKTNSLGSLPTGSSFDAGVSKVHDGGKKQVLQNPHLSKQLKKTVTSSSPRRSKDSYLVTQKK
eukprot:Awhi_evm1s30